MVTRVDLTKPEGLVEHGSTTWKKTSTSGPGSKKLVVMGRSLHPLVEKCRLAISVY